MALLVLLLLVLLLFLLLLFLLLLLLLFRLPLQLSSYFLRLKRSTKHEVLLN